MRSDCLVRQVIPSEESFMNNTYNIRIHRNRAILAYAKNTIQARPLGTT